PYQGMGPGITSERLCTRATEIAAVRYSISNCSNGQRKLELCTSRSIPGNQQSPAMSLNNGSANRQPQPHSFALAREERFEDALQFCRCDSRTRILDGNDTFSRVAPLGSEP